MFNVYSGPAVVTARSPSPTNGRRRRPSRQRAIFSLLGVLSLLIDCACSTREQAQSTSAQHGEHLGSELVGRIQQALHDETAPLCTFAAPYGSKSWTYDNDRDGGDDKYRTPMSVFVADRDNPKPEELAALESTLEDLHAHMPVLSPYPNPTNNPSVRTTSGWYYEFTSSDPHSDIHAAVDIEVTDPSTQNWFDVRAVAAGQVVSRYYSPGNGNMVIIEHQATDGTLYRSLYFHLRDGAQHDCTAAKDLLMNDPDVAMNHPKYDTFVGMFPDTCTGLTSDLALRSWGTNDDDDDIDDAIVPGNYVAAGAHIARSGNTGFNGVEGGLDPGGFPNNTERVNNHLHFHLAVWLPAEGRWMFVDPHGIYNEHTDGCYNQVLANTEYKRLFAPFFPSFHGIDHELFAHFFDYYPGTGLGLQTLSVHPGPGPTDMLASGSFQLIAPEWEARHRVSASDFEDFITSNENAGRQLREISVTQEPDGTPSYTGIWGVRTATVDSVVDIDGTDADYSATFASVYPPADALLADHFVYYDGEERRHASIANFGGQPQWYSPWDADLSTFQSLIATEEGNGFRGTSVNAELRPCPSSELCPASNTTRWGGVMVPAQGDWVVDPNIEGGHAGYQTRFEQMVGQGYRLYRIQGFDRGERYAAIWARNEVVPQANPVAVAERACAASGVASARLDASASQVDPAFPVTYEWLGPFGSAAGETFDTELSIGSHTIVLSMWDARGLKASTSIVATIEPDATPPTLVAPSDIVTSACADVNLGQPVAFDDCEGTVVVANDAPSVFPLGISTVTWTATDDSGNVTTDVQAVTAVLGDDASCCPGGTNVIEGSSENDTLTGTNGADCILGKGGQDTIQGLGGDDYISAGDGDDIVNAGAGADTVLGGSGQDDLFGGSGNDSLFGNDGDDELRGEGDHDSLFGGQGQDLLLGQEGDDLLVGEDGTDTCDGGPGLNTLTSCELETPTCNEATYQAENMSATTGGPISGGWNLWANGSLTTTHGFTAGPTTVTVRARGEQAAGILPHMVVSVGGTQIGSANVAVGSFQPYTFGFTAPGGTQTISVVFDNDYYVPPADRNLLVDNVSVDCEESSGGGVLSATLDVDDWGSGYCVDLLVQNHGTADVTGWSVTLDLDGTTITGSWNGAFSGASGIVTAAPAHSWNQTIAAGQVDDSIGFCASRNDPGSGDLAIVVSTSP